jgi:hypothetical protein
MTVRKGKFSKNHFKPTSSAPADNEQLRPKMNDNPFLRIPALKDPYSIMNRNRSFLGRMVQEIKETMARNEKPLRKDQIERIAANNYLVTDKTEVKELTEAAIVTIARQLLHERPKGEFRGGHPITTLWHDILLLYRSQPNLSHRSSTSTIYQQYSTAVPIAFLAGVYCLPGDPETILEPSAGNGLLTIVFKPETVVVNEIDANRLSILGNFGFKNIFNEDASKRETFYKWQKSFDAVVSNPPFDKLPTKEKFGEYGFGALDHVMAAYALSALKDNGRAAIIIGGHTEYDEKGRINAGKNREFVSFLYENYLVDDIININGDLYSRQGTQFDIRLILIRGRKKEPGGYAPLYQALPEHQKQVENDFQGLFDRVLRYVPLKQPIASNELELMEMEAQALELELDLLEFAAEAEKTDPYEIIHKAIVKGISEIKSVGNVFNLYENPNKYGDTKGQITFLYNIIDKYNYLSGSVSVDYKSGQVFIPEVGNKIMGNLTPEAVLDQVRKSYPKMIKGGFSNSSKDYRFVVFLLDTKHQEHDGIIVKSIDEARAIAREGADGIEADKAMIGMFLLDPKAEELPIKLIEKIGFGPRRIESLYSDIPERGLEPAEYFHPKAWHIVMLADSTSEKHSGKIFAAAETAKEFIVDALDKKRGFTTKMAVGMAVFSPSDERNASISHIDTLGINGAIKDHEKAVQRIKLFQYTKKREE